MKNKLLSIIAILTLTCCTNNMSNRELIKEAETYRKSATIEADKWLNKFNETGYPIFFDLQFPPPFEKILFDSIRSIQQHPSAFDKNKYDSLKRNEIQKWVNLMEQKYGIVTEREFIGIHIITKGRLLTYAPDRMKGFQFMNPKILGLNKVKQLYIKNVEGTYAYLMYKAKTAKREYAEELIILWLDQHNKWRFLLYKIADNI